jgi:hypothetical protein
MFSKTHEYGGAYATLHTCTFHRKPQRSLCDVLDLVRRELWVLVTLDQNRSCAGNQPFRKVQSVLEQVCDDDGLCSGCSRSEKSDKANRTCAACDGCQEERCRVTVRTTFVVLPYEKRVTETKTCSLDASQSDR